MSYSTFDDMPRRNRRLILRDEGIARRAGKWTKWETLRFPRGSVHTRGWTADILIAHRNNVFSVLDRTLPDGTRHLGYHVAFWRAADLAGNAAHQRRDRRSGSDRGRGLPASSGNRR